MSYTLVKKNCQINNNDYICSDSKFETNLKPAKLRILGVDYLFKP